METNEERKLREEFEKITEEILDLTQDEFQFIDLNRSIINEVLLRKFYIFSCRGSLELLNAWKVIQDNNSFYLCNVAYETTISIRGQYSSYSSTQKHSYFYGFLKPGKSFGRSLIRPETLQDKISEVFKNHEIDFKENKEFSSKYFCESLDREKFVRNLSPRLMDYLCTLDYLEIEFNDDGCLFRMEHSIWNKKEAFKFPFIGIKLSSLLND